LLVACGPSRPRPGMPRCGHLRWGGSAISEAAALVAAVLHDVDLLAVVPRRLGMSGDNLHRLPDRAPEPLIPTHRRSGSQRPSPATPPSHLGGRQATVTVGLRPPHVDGLSIAGTASTRIRTTTPNPPAAPEGLRPEYCGRSVQRAPSRGRDSALPSRYGGAWCPRLLSSYRSCGARNNRI
jgi:hypothetical protein